MVGIGLGSGGASGAVSTLVGRLIADGRAAEKRDCEGALWSAVTKLPLSLARAASPLLSGVSVPEMTPSKESGCAASESGQSVTALQSARLARPCRPKRPDRAGGRCGKARLTCPRRAAFLAGEVTAGGGIGQSCLLPVVAAGAW